jgi:hypothetical protein
MIVLGPVTEPELVDRAQIVTRVDADRVSIEVQNFDAPVHGTVMLAVIWSALPPRHGQAVSGCTVTREAPSGPGYDPLVKAYSRALASVAADIAMATRAAAAVAHQPPDAQAVVDTSVPVVGICECPLRLSASVCTNDCNVVPEPLSPSELIRD